MGSLSKPVSDEGVSISFLLKYALHYAFVIFIIILYFGSGITITCYNKFLLSPAFYNFPFPVAMICTHMLSNFLLSAVSIRTPCLSEQVKQQPEHYSNISLKYYLTKFSLVGAFFGLDIVFTNISFRYVSVSLTEVIKSGVPASLMVIGFFTGRERTSTVKTIVVMTLTLGIILTSLGEFRSAHKNKNGEGPPSFDIRGFFAAIAALICAVLRLILMERLLGGGLRKPLDVELSEQEVQLGETSSGGIESTQLSLIHSESSETTPLPQPTIKTSSSSSAPTLNSPHRQNSRSPRLNPISSAIIDVSSNYEFDEDGPKSSQESQGDISSISSADIQSPNQKTTKLHPMLSLFYFTPMSLVVLFPMFAVLEYNNLMKYTAEHSTEHFWETCGMLAIGASLAFGLNVSELFLIQATSALTLCVLSVVKFMLVLWITSVLFTVGEISTVNIIGLVCSCLGVASYNLVKWKELNVTSRIKDAAASNAVSAVTTRASTPKIPADESFSSHNGNTKFPFAISNIKLDQLSKETQKLLNHLSVHSESIQQLNGTAENHLVNISDLTNHK